MFELVAGNHHGAGWMTTGIAVFLWCLLPFTLGIYVVRLIRDKRRWSQVAGIEKMDLSDRLFGWSISIVIQIGALFLATHRLVGSM